MLNKVIFDNIDSGHFDRELGEIARNPEYAEYTAMELKAVLTDRISNNMVPEHHCGLQWLYRAAVVVLLTLLGVAITYN